MYVCLYVWPWVDATKSAVAGMYVCVYVSLGSMYVYMYVCVHMYTCRHHNGHKYFEIDK
jgi:hypothetical protein